MDSFVLIKQMKNYLLKKLQTKVLNQTTPVIGLHKLMRLDILPGRVAQSVTCLVTDACLTA